MQASKTQTTPTIIDRIGAFIRQYVQVGDDELRLIALWVLHSWAFSGNYTTPYTTPYLYVYSAERQSGKTRLLETLGYIVRNPLASANLTAATMFAAIESENPTLMIDEVDAIWSGAKNEEMRGVLNAGYKRGGKALRRKPGSEEISQFNVFGPKALAGIDNNMLPDTVRDRTIPIHMHRQKVGQDDSAKMMFAWIVEPEAAELVELIVAWMDEYYERIAREIPPPVEGISDRAFEITMPLLQLAHAFGAKFVADTRKAIARLLATPEQVLGPGQQLLADIREIFDAEGDGVKALATATICEKLDGDWNGKLLANRLRPYGVTGLGGTVRINNKVTKGLKRADFEDAWSRYLA